MASMRRLVMVSGFWTLVACPPPAELASGPNQGAGGGDGAAVGEPGMNDGGGVAPKVDLKGLEASFSQEEMKAQDHVVVSGILDGPCDGYVRVQAIEDGERDPTQGNGLITYVDVDNADYDGSTAPWSIAVPKDTALILNGLCDGDRDGVVDLATEGGSPLEHFKPLSENVDDVVLSIADMVAGVADQTPVPEGGDGAVAPPPTDGAVPPPPEGGAAMGAPPPGMPVGQPPSQPAEPGATAPAPAPADGASVGEEGAAVEPAPEGATPSGEAQ